MEASSPKVSAPRSVSTPPPSHTPGRTVDLPQHLRRHQEDTGTDNRAHNQQGEIA